VYLAAVAEEVGDAGVDRLIGVFSRESEAQGGGAMNTGPGSGLVGHE